MLITSRSSISSAHYLHSMVGALRFGVTSIQPLGKRLSDVELLRFAKEIQVFLRSSSLFLHITLIVNDSVDICLGSDADGVHLGQTDDDSIYARKQPKGHRAFGQSA